MHLDVGHDELRGAEDFAGTRQASEVGHLVDEGRADDEPSLHGPPAATERPLAKLVRRAQFQALPPNLRVVGGENTFV